jgi:hypothetical protein
LLKERLAVTAKVEFFSSFTSNNIDIMIKKEGEEVSGIARTINTRIHNDLPPDSKGEKQPVKPTSKKGKSRNSLRE